ncbi:unnamed protein product [Amoebophrya sp. A120]|nr:unnamed protein product [Amoebophrya sp. A120]|eukprot:GSA120T00006361001.1
MLSRSCRRLKRVPKANSLLAKNVRDPGNKNYGKDEPLEKRVNPFEREEAPTTFGASKLEDIHARDTAYFENRARQLRNEEGRREVREFFERQEELRKEPQRLANLDNILEKEQAFLRQIREHEHQTSHGGDSMNQEQLRLFKAGAMTKNLKKHEGQNAPAQLEARTTEPVLSRSSYSTSTTLEMLNNELASRTCSRDETDASGSAGVVPSERCSSSSAAGAGLTRNRKPELRLLSTEKFRSPEEQASQCAARAARWERKTALFLEYLNKSPEERRQKYSLTNSLDPDFQAKERLPWRIRRTAYGNLPVYERFKRGGIEAYTVIRGIEGNVRSLHKQLCHVCEAPARQRTGAFEVRGLHSWKLKEWLASLGF